MRTSLATMAPLVLTLSAAGWLIWNLMGDATPEAAKVKLARIDDALLSPKLGAPPARDPFQGPEAASAPASALPGAAMVATQARAATPPPGPTATVVAPKAVPASGPSFAQGVSRTVTSAVSALRRWWRMARHEIETREELAREVQAEVAGQARLSATSIRGASRMAILNDRAYAEGETIANLGSLRGPVLVSRIRPSSVVLRYRGASAVVSFPSIGKASAGAGGPKPPASRPNGRASGRGKP